MINKRFLLFYAETLIPKKVKKMSRKKYKDKSKSTFLQKHINVLYTVNKFFIFTIMGITTTHLTQNIIL